MLRRRSTIPDLASGFLKYLSEGVDNVPDAPLVNPRIRDEDGISFLIINEVRNFESFVCIP